VNDNGINLLEVNDQNVDPDFFLVETSMITRIENWDWVAAGDYSSS
jgi:hypothetical protein